MPSQLLVLDTTDDRKEIWHCLHRLSPKARVQFLVWACRQVPQGKGRLPVPVVTKLATALDQAYRCDRANERVTNEVYSDVIQLFNSFGLDAIATANELVQWLKRPEYRRFRVAQLAFSSS